MKRLKRIIKSKDGNATYIIGVAFIFLMIIITYAIMFLSTRNAMIMDIKKTSQVTLDSYVSEESVGNYSSIKNSNSYIENVKPDKYKENLIRALRLNNNMESYDGNTLKYRLSNVRLTMEDENNLKLKAVIHLYMPFYFLGIESAIDTDIPIKSKYEFK